MRCSLDEVDSRNLLNVTADKWFSEIVDELVMRKLTYIGNVKEIKGKYLENSNHKGLEKSFLLYLVFSKYKTLCSHIPKQNKDIVPISLMHHSNTLDNRTKNLEMII